MAFQLDLLNHSEDSTSKSDALGVSFRDSRAHPIHRWYPYVEGFSSEYIQSLFAEATSGSWTVYDPFGGSGTVCLIASQLGFRSLYSELNPFMQRVSNAKVNSSAWAKKNLADSISILEEFRSVLESDKFERAASKIDLASYEAAFPKRDFFEEQHIRELLAAKHLAHAVASGIPQVEELLLVGISSVLVHNSNMTRRADLRRRKPGEYKNRVVDVRSSIAEKVRHIAEDIRFAGVKKTKLLNANARQFNERYRSAVDEIVTSPPYLNGTNYFRNTKIEMWFLGEIDGEASLTDFNRDCVAGGISNVTNSRSDHAPFESVEKIVTALSNTKGDKRIARMVRYYFNDMHEVLSNSYMYLKPGGKMVLDIGDSRFYGVHVPTDKLLMDVGKSVGFELFDVKTLARRHSRDKTPLQQVEIVLRRPASQSDTQ